MMRQTAMFGYGAADDVQVLELPYLGKNFSMFVLLPKEVDGLADLEKKLSVETLKAWTSGLKTQTVEVFLPKFKMTSSFRLEKVLGSMGMPLAFSGEADFSGMTGKRDLFISAVIHKAFVDVTEHGTEAAAATAVMMARAASAAEESDLPRRSSVPLPDSRQPDGQHPVPGTNDESKSVTETEVMCRLVRQ